MWETVKRWWTICSVAVKLILAICGVALAATLVLSARKKRATALQQRAEAKRLGLLAEANASEREALANHVQAIQAVSEAESHEAAADEIEARLRVSREKVAGLRKELGL